jgi:hypothetical protein
MNFYGWTRLWNCFADGYTAAEITSQIADVYNYMSTRAASGIRPTPTCTFDRITGMEPYYGFQRYGTGNVSLSNLFLRGIALAGNVFGYLNGLNTAPSNIFLDNVDSDAWTFTWIDSASAVVYRRYKFDLITETSATVTLKNADGTTAFSVTSDAVTGAIVTQMVIRGTFDQAHGNSMQEYGPFTLTITKAGKMPTLNPGLYFQLQQVCLLSYVISLQEQPLLAT